MTEDFSINETITLPDFIRRSHGSISNDFGGLTNIMLAITLGAKIVFPWS